MTFDHYVLGIAALMFVVLGLGNLYRAAFHRLPVVWRFWFLVEAMIYFAVAFLLTNVEVC